MFRTYEENGQRYPYNYKDGTQGKGIGKQRNGKETSGKREKRFAKAK